MKAASITCAQRAALAAQREEARAVRPTLRLAYADTELAHVLGGDWGADFARSLESGGLSASSGRRAQSSGGAPPRGISRQRWKGPGWYYVWHVGEHDGAQHELLQLCFVESDGTLSAFDEVDEVGAQV